MVDELEGKVQLAMQDLEDSDSLLDIEHAKFFYEFKYRGIIEAATRLTQVGVVFFGITSAIIGLAVLTEFTDEQRQLILSSLVFLVAAFIVIAGAIMYGVIAGIMQVRDTLILISKSTYQRLGMHAFFRRLLIVLFVISIAALVGIVGVVLTISKFA